MAEPFDDQRQVDRQPEGRQAPPRQNLSADGLNAVSFFAIGVASEGGKNPYALEFAGNIRNGRLEPADRSGITIGNLQIDLGQRPAVATELVDAYQAWARTERPQDLFTAQQRQQAITDLSRDGDAIRADAGRPMNAVSQSRLNTFLASESGIDFVHRHDAEQARELALEAFRPLAATRLYADASVDDQIRIATVVGKLHNQNPREAGRILERAGNDEFRDFEQLNGAITGIGARYITGGRDDALEGAEVMIALRNSAQGNPLRDDWGAVMRNPLVNPNRLDDNPANPNLPQQYAVVKELFVQRTQSRDFIEALDQGGTHRYGRRSADGTRFTENGLYASGNDFAIWNQQGEGVANAGGELRRFDRDNLSRVQNRDGTIDLRLDESGRQIDLLHIDPQAPALRPAAPRQPGAGQPEEPGRPANRAAEPERRAETSIDHPLHDNFGMYAALLAIAHERDDALERPRDGLSVQLAGGLTEVARRRELDSIGFAQFSPEGSRVYMSDTSDPSAPWAKTAVGDVGQLVGQPLTQSSESIARINEQLALKQEGQQQAQQQTVAQSGPAIRGPSIS